MTSLLRAALATVVGVAIAGSAREAFAQSGNGSDVTGPAFFSLAGGAFAPLPLSGGTRVASSDAVLMRVRRIGTAFASGTPTRSPVTGQLIPAEAVQAVGELIATGSPAADARVARALQAGGASPAEVAALTEGLGELSRVSSGSAPAALTAVSQRFNALVKSVPVEFMRSPPAQFLAVHAALASMVNAIRR